MQSQTGEDVKEKCRSEGTQAGGTLQAHKNKNLYNSEYASDGVGNFYKGA